MLRIGIIGMGGFAQSHHKVCLELEREGLCRVVSACDPHLENFATEQEQFSFRERGVQTFTDYREMLDACQDSLDVVTVPTPVPLHASMHRACVERGIACYLEKPPTLNVAELEEMLAVEAGASKSTQVGFNFIVEEPRQALKARILSGEFGAVETVGFWGLWPRLTTYFTRAEWAGRLEMDGKLVLDSCSGNGLSHHVHNVHFWCGQREVLDWEEIVTMEAEMYRAHDIEGMDTVFASGGCANGIGVQMVLSHACAGPHRHKEWIACEKAVLSYHTGADFRIDWEDGRRERGATDRRDLLKENLRDYFAYVQGEKPQPLNRLQDTRPFVRGYNLTYLAAKRITTVSEPYVLRSANSNGPGEFVAIQDIDDATEAFISTGQFPSEHNFGWARPGSKATLEDLPHLPETIAAMVAARGEERL